PPPRNAAFHRCGAAGTDLASLTVLRRRAAMRSDGPEGAMTRRAFLGGALVGGLAAPLAAVAEPPTRPRHRIGMVERTSPTANAANVDAFRRGMREQGYAEAQAFV